MSIFAKENVTDMSHRIHFLIFTGLLLMFCSCRKENRFEWQVNQRHMEVSLNKESDSLYVIHLNTDQPSHSVWKLPYPVYQFDYGDVTGDGMPEIIVGVIKPTRSTPNPTSGYLFTGLQMKRISAHFG